MFLSLVGSGVVQVSGSLSVLICLKGVVLHSDDDRQAVRNINNKKKLKI